MEAMERHKALEGGDALHGIRLRESRPGETIIPYCHSRPGLCIHNK